MEHIVQLVNGSIKIPDEVMKFLGVEIGDRIAFRRDGSVRKAEFGGVEIGENNEAVIPKDTVNQFVLKEEQGVILYEKNGELMIEQDLRYALERASEALADAPEWTEEEILDAVMRVRYGDDYADKL